MKQINNIKYTEYGTMEGGDFTATVRVKVNPYLSGVFARVVKENHREICCGAYDKGNGIIDIDFIDVYDAYFSEHSEARLSTYVNAIGEKRVGILDTSADDCFETLEQWIKKWFRISD